MAMFLLFVEQMNLKRKIKKEIANTALQVNEENLSSKRTKMMQPLNLQSNCNVATDGGMWFMTNVYNIKCQI